ncbi:hypothetical protein HRbin36_01077 [bacterium HR36]|nr:hypothetical protein HRbin36_01077 [bacterium HR36]
MSRASLTTRRVASQLCLVGLVLLGLCGNQAARGQQVTLAWKLRPGEVFYYLMDTTVTTTVGPAEAENTTKARLVMLYRYHVLETKPDGYALEQTVEDVLTDDKTFLGATYNQFKGLKLKITFDRSFRITKIEGHEQLLKRIGADDPVVGKFVAELVNENAIRQQIQSEFNFLPDKPVAPGDNWQRQITFAVGPLGTLTLQQTLTYEGTVAVASKRLDRISVSAKCAYAPPKPSDDFPLRVTKGELQTDYVKGTILFDREEGRLASAEWQAKYRLKLTVASAKPDGGKEFSMEMTQIQQNRTEVSEERPNLPNLDSR